MKKVLTILLSTIFFVLAAAGCKPQEEEPAGVTLLNIEISAAPDKTEYFTGEAFDAEGMEVTAYYSDDTQKAVNDYTIEPSGALKPDNTSVTVKYTEDGISVTAFQPVIVTDRPVLLDYIFVSKAPSKTSYTEGESFDIAGMEITAVYSDSSRAALTDYRYSPAGELEFSDTEITVIYSEGNIEKTVIIPVAVTLAEYTVKFNIGSNAINLTEAPLTQITGRNGSIAVPALYREFYSYTWDTEVISTGIKADAEYTAVWKKETKLPVVKVSTDNAPITSKETYVNGTGTFTETSSNINVFTDSALEIRGRGNSSWTESPKKSYRIKFGTKTSLFGLSAAKSWVFQANYFDKTLIRNYLVYEYGNTLSGLPYTPTPHFVDFYLNGAYQGVYMVCEHVEAATGRVPVKEPKAGDTDCDYMLEMDYRAFDEGLIEGYDYIKADYGQFENKSAFVIKSPKTDESPYNTVLFNYINSSFRTVEAAVMSTDYANIFPSLEALIDINSFIDYFLVQELFKNGDAGFSSVFMYKTKKGKFTMSPLWDFDLSMGGGYTSQNTAGEFRVSVKNKWFENLMKIPQFKARYTARWNELYVSSIPGLLTRIKELEKAMAASSVKDNAVWNTLNIRTWPNNTEITKIKTYAGQITYMYSFMNTRMVWLNTKYNTQ